METDCCIESVDRKSDQVRYYLNGNEIGTRFRKKVYVKPFHYYQKLSFMKGKYFQLLEKIIQSDNIELIDRVRIESEFGKMYTIDQFLTNLGNIGEIK